MFLLLTAVCGVHISYLLVLLPGCVRNAACLRAVFFVHCMWWVGPQGGFIRVACVVARRPIGRMDAPMHSRWLVHNVVPGYTSTVAED